MSGSFIFIVILIALACLIVIARKPLHPAHLKSVAAMFAMECPYCRVRISDRATHCPHCGQPTGFDTHSMHDRL